LERSAGITALVMELIEGPTLADRVAQGAIPIDEALPIAKQIAEALDAAHEQGIVHRDLKPANVKVRLDGTVKVLDFGLAKAMEPAGVAAAGTSLAPTVTTPAMTRAGMLLGTAAYMSPEQARGKPVDKRADIWAFGCVVYEMLTGRTAFAGETVSSLRPSFRTNRTGPGCPPRRRRPFNGCCGAVCRRKRGTAFATLPTREWNWTMRSAGPARLRRSTPRCGHDGHLFCRQPPSRRVFSPSGY
jgi:eukaryotic-like serine/threonine-protein kinase